MKQDEHRLQRALVEAIGFMELDLPCLAAERLQAVADLGRNVLQWCVVAGEALRSCGRFEEAIAPLENAVRQAPDQVDIYLSLGWCYKRSNQLSLAIRALETAHRLQPKNDLILYNLACYHALAGHRATALDFLSRAVRRSERWRELTLAESDFDPIRDDPEFQRLLGAGKNVHR